MSVYSSGAEAMQAILGPESARLKAEALAYHEAELTRMSRAFKARMEAEWARERDALFREIAGAR